MCRSTTAAGSMALTCGSPPLTGSGAGALARASAPSLTAPLTRFFFSGLSPGLRLSASPRRNLQRLVADELALAVVVGGDHDFCGSLGDGTQRRDRAGSAAVDDPGEVRPLDHVGEVLETPALVRVGEHRLHHVAAQPDGHGVVAFVREVIGLHLGGRGRAS